MERILTIVTALVAVYGAALSTINYRAARKEKRRVVKVELSQGFLVVGDGLSPPVLFIEARNPGARPVTLNSPTLNLPNGKRLCFPNPLSDVQFPYELSEGKNCRVWVEMRELADQLRRCGLASIVSFTGVYNDLVGGSYESKPLKLDVSEL